jgi:hypothetical protein
MKTFLLSAAMFCALALVPAPNMRVYAQPLYFPPLTGNEWETISPAPLGWNVAQIDPFLNNQIWQKLNLMITPATGGIRENGFNSSPKAFELSQNRPNPFNSATTISFQLPEDSRVTLQVFDVNGREVATLVDGEMAAGKHAVAFAPGNWAGGIYFYKITAGKFTQNRKAILMK